LSLPEKSDQFVKVERLEHREEKIASREKEQNPKEHRALKAGATE
jgi:hypothetical protein